MSNFLSLHDEEGRAVVLYTNTNNLTVALGHVSDKRKFQVGPTLFSFSVQKIGRVRRKTSLYFLKTACTVRRSLFHDTLNIEACI